MSTSAAPKPIPDTYRRVTPCLVVRDAAKALEFHGEVFAAAERMCFPGPGGTIVHAETETEIGDSVVMVEDASPDTGTQAPPAGGPAGSPPFLFVHAEDVGAVVARAVELGATLKRPPENQFHGDRDACVVDPYGHTWTVATHVEDVAPEELARRMSAPQEQGGDA